MAMARGTYVIDVGLDPSLFVAGLRKVRDALALLPGYDVAPLDKAIGELVRICPPVELANVAE